MLVVISVRSASLGNNLFQYDLSEKEAQIFVECFLLFGLPKEGHSGIRCDEGLTLET